MIYKITIKGLLDAVISSSCNQNWFWPFDLKFEQSINVNCDVMRDK